MPTESVSFPPPLYEKMTDEVKRRRENGDTKITVPELIRETLREKFGVA